MVGTEKYYIHPLRHLSDNRKFALDLNHRVFSLRDLFVPTLHPVTISMGRAILGHVLLKAERAIQAGPIPRHPAIRCWMHFILNHNHIFHFPLAGCPAAINEECVASDESGSG